VTFGGQISDEVAEELVTVAYDSGINLFDTAEVYAAGKYVAHLSTMTTGNGRWILLLERKSPWAKF
jgi:potassium voltage-gated channel Shaker-related subfamily A, beta member 1